MHGRVVVRVGVSSCSSASPVRLKHITCKGRGGFKAPDTKRSSSMQSPGKDPVRSGFHRVEIQETTWDVPVRYSALRAIGSGAYGTVW